MHTGAHFLLDLGIRIDGYEGGFGTRNNGPCGTDWAMEVCACWLYHACTILEWIRWNVWVMQAVASWMYGCVVGAIANCNTCIYLHRSHLNVSMLCASRLRAVQVGCSGSSNERDGGLARRPAVASLPHHDHHHDYISTTYTYILRFMPPARPNHPSNRFRTLAPFLGLLNILRAFSNTCENHDIGESDRQ
jgi:hypothetical protein